MNQQRTLESIRVDYPAPDHVPAHLKVDLSWAQGYIPNDLVDPYAPLGWLSGPDVPRLLYAPAVPGASTDGFGVGSVGTWVVSHYEDIERVYTDNDLFSNKGTVDFQAMIGETFPSIPLAIDPPDHHKYRMYLMPHFSPRRLNQLEEQIRRQAVSMIDEFADKGEVDVAWNFGRIYPVRIFMGLMGFPAEMFEQFLDWEWEILHSGTTERMTAALRGVVAYLREIIAEKEANPDDGIVSSIVHGKLQGEALTADEKMGMVWFLWLGGLDTVAATISQMFRRMAMQPEIQDQLRADPSLIPTAIEEFLRTQPIINAMRRAQKDFEWHGVTIKAGETVICWNSAGNFDPAKFDRPRDFDAERKGNRHFTFVAGIHLCLGAPLARRELRILLEEWFKRIPAFRLKPGASAAVFPGLLSIRNLPLVWDPTRRA